MGALLDRLKTQGRTSYKVLAIDPGEHVGMATVCVGAQPFINVDLAQISGLGTVNVNTVQGPEASIVRAAHLIEETISAQTPDIVILESYRIYSWKAKEHTWASLFTPRLIGAIEYICDRCQVVLRKQSPQQRTFVTDDKLKAWDLYDASVGIHHARDALRHAIVHLLFGDL